MRVRLTIATAVAAVASLIPCAVANAGMNDGETVAPLGMNDGETVVPLEMWGSSVTPLEMWGASVTPDPAVVIESPV